MEDFGYLKDDDNKKTGRVIKKALLIGATLFSISCFIYITISAYRFVYNGGGNQVIQTIKSPPKPIKVIEEYNYEEAQNSEGNGIKINKEIYEDIFGNKKESLNKSPKHLLLAEQPVSPPDLTPLILEQEAIEETRKITPDLALNNADIKLATNKNKYSSIRREEIYQQNLAKNTDKKIIVFSENNQQNNQASVINAKKEALLAKQVLKKPNNLRKKRIIRVQIAAFNSKKLANDYWKNLDNNYNYIFANLKPYIEEADLGKKGIFYRLQIGNFINQIDAENFCKSFVAQTKKTRLDCIIVE
jgi:sRNA-binding carbon storage regulator CsrA